MSVYLIGDIQGCDEALGRLLQQLAFSPSRDRLCVLGDLVNRGPDSARVLRRLMALGSAVQCVLGNHDLHLLAVAAGASKTKRLDTLDDVLQAPDRPALLDWLRQQPLALHEHGILMVHAGVLPSWSVPKTLALAAEAESALRDAQGHDFLHSMYGNVPNAWHDTLTGTDRLRVVVNALTRLRFCSDQGVMEFNTKEGADAAPKGFMPWFEVPGRQTAHVPIAFGHWSSLGWLDRSDVLSLDTGCVWGGCLSALRLQEKGAHTLIQVKCPPTLMPSQSPP